jgi:hypothetical protein
MVLAVALFILFVMKGAALAGFWQRFTEAGLLDSQHPTLLHGAVSADSTSPCFPVIKLPVCCSAATVGVADRRPRLRDAIPRRYALPGQDPPR